MGTDQRPSIRERSNPAGSPSASPTQDRSNPPTFTQDKPAYQMQPLLKGREGYDLFSPLTVPR
ncbi:MAG: hypothetical protein CMM01_26225 [Rhodopirellula sp.]|nr:hypothetical protein [Rhodopirellula sp.]